MYADAAAYLPLAKRAAHKWYKHLRVPGLAYDDYQAAAYLGLAKAAAKYSYNMAACPAKCALPMGRHTICVHGRGPYNFAALARAFVDGECRHLARGERRRVRYQNAYAWCLACWPWPVAAVATQY